VVFSSNWAIIGQVFLLRFPKGAISPGTRILAAAGLIDSIMKPELVKAASEVIRNQHILVNLVSRRVRQLTLGHRPMVEFVPGMGHADIALSEIANGKLTFESTHGQNGHAPEEVVQFPGVIVAKKTKKAA
jgi:DNA-directed RNA polymerase subunit omega